VKGSPPSLSLGPYSQGGRKLAGDLKDAVETQDVPVVHAVGRRRGAEGGGRDDATAEVTAATSAVAVLFSAEEAEAVVRSISTKVKLPIANTARLAT